MLEGILNSKSKTFLAFCFCFLGGITLASLTSVRLEVFHLVGMLIGGVGLLIVFFDQTKARFVFLACLFFMGGVVRYSFAFPDMTPEHVAFYNGKQVDIQAIVVAEPDVRQDGVRYILESQKISSPFQHDDVYGNIYVKQGLYPRYAYGEVVDVKCTLETPEPIEDFRYDMYLARYGVFSICQKPIITSTGETKGKRVLGVILAGKQYVAKQINLLWHEPYAGFMAGLLYGYRGGLGSLNEAFNRTGVTHIIAVSGYNITLVAVLMSSFLTYLWIPRKKAFWFICIGIAVFVLFTGASASVVRAGIMGIVVLVARQMGRGSAVLNSIMLTAVVMSLHNPFVFMWDAGFQLSFLATLGLVYIAPLLEPYFNWVPERFGLQEMLISTLAAILVTAPLIGFQFGRTSLVAPIVNILILWILPFVMSLGALAVILSFLFYPVGQLVAWMGWIGMAYVVWVVRWFAGLSHASVDWRISWYVMVGLYVLMLWWVINVKTQKNKKVFA